MDDAELFELYVTYNVENDPTGGKGNMVAELVLRRCGYDFDKFKKWLVMGTITC